MKKCNFIFLIVLSLSFFSCKTVHQVLANQKFDNRVGIEELSRPVNNNIIPFTLNNKADYGCPVVCMEINNQKALFLVDTGFPKTIMISDNGLKKLNIDLETFKSSRLDDYLYFLKENFPQKYNKIKDNPKKLKKQLYKDLKKGLAFLNLKKVSENKKFKTVKTKTLISFIALNKDKISIFKITNAKKTINITKKLLSTEAIK